MSLSNTEKWVVVWKFPSDLFQIPIWTFDIRSKVVLPVGYYPLIKDFGPFIKTNTEMPLNLNVFKMRQLVDGVNIHTLQGIDSLNNVVIPMISWEYFIYNKIGHAEIMWNPPTHKQKTMMTNMFAELKDFNVDAFCCHSQHHAAVVFYTFNGNIFTCEMLTYLLTQDAFVSILKRAVLGNYNSDDPIPNMKNQFTEWVTKWKSTFAAGGSSAGSSGV